MIKAVLTDFSRVIIMSNTDVPSLNRHHRELKTTDDYRFFEHFFLNYSLLERLEKISHTIPVYIATTGALHELAEVKSHLGMITDSFTGLAKSDPGSYTDIAKLLKLKPEEILYIDDSATPIASATAAGLVAIRYTDNATLFAELDHYLR
jgi:HAD superfamily hydrolase (TIGR01509 family)